MQDGVFDRIKHNFDVFRVYCCCKVVEEWFARVTFYTAKVIHKKLLDIHKAPLVPRELWKEPTNVGLSCLELFSQQVCLVEKKDYGDSSKNQIVDNGIKNVLWLF